MRAMYLAEMPCGEGIAFLAVLGAIVWFVIWLLTPSKKASGSESQQPAPAEARRLTGTDVVGHSCDARRLAGSQGVRQTEDSNPLTRHASEIATRLAAAAAVHRLETEAARTRLLQLAMEGRDFFPDDVERLFLQAGAMDVAELDRSYALLSERLRARRDADAARSELLDSASAARDLVPDFVKTLEQQVVALDLAGIKRMHADLAERVHVRQHELAVEEYWATMVSEYAFRPCPRCNEDDFNLIELSPKGGSAFVECKYCGKRSWAHAIGSEAAARLDLALRKAKDFEPAFSPIGKTFALGGHRAQDGVAVGRERIPDPLARAVFQRDQGQCVSCHAKEQLEIDHVVPVSKGGATTLRNLQLLCQRCNRSKGGWR
jgi:hypothetical protein